MTRLTKQYLAMAAAVLAPFLGFLYWWFCGYNPCWWCL